MASSKKIKIRGVYRSGSHLPIWTIIERQGIWDQVGLEMASFEYCAQPPEAEKALFKGEIDFISGDHLTPYGLVVKGAPIVSIASPVNAVTATIVSREPIKSIQELRGKRIVDTPMEGRDGGFHHGRGNHMMYLIRSGVALNEVTWVEHEDSEAQVEAMKSGKGDATFSSGSAREYQEAGFHMLPLGPLPMINGATLTTSYTVLKKHKELGERLVKALVLGIHFAHTRKAESEKILQELSKQNGGSYRYDRLLRMPRKPYPDPQAIINAYELGCMKSTEAKEISPLALWDLHYLRELDQSGFINKLYA
jgi:ABC-type nitrate/sulfonate/bicarbonate transport system substrate-binding protein